MIAKYEVTIRGPDNEISILLDKPFEGNAALIWLRCSNDVDKVIKALEIMRGTKHSGAEPKEL